MYRMLLLCLLFIPCLLPAQQKITSDDIRMASKILSMDFSGQEIDSMLPAIQRRAALYDRMHRYNLENPAPYALHFSPLLPGMSFSEKNRQIDVPLPASVLPANKDDLAFMSIAELASLIKSRKITSVELTRFFLDRLKKYGDTLQCVISLTEDSALAQARQMDAEISSGLWRGLLHGIPYGLKDLFAVKGSRTTWGARPYREQIIETDSYVYAKLKASGAVLIAKLTTGALAMGDYWFGGRTKNPWNLLAGSSGSSSGSAAATVAGLVPFAIGTETYGSLISPATVCGATTLRPTFGSISRSGAMALSWSLDKPGPLCRSARDGAIVFYYLQGTDGQDASAVNRSFSYTRGGNLSALRIGYAANYFRKDTMGNEQRFLDILTAAGATLTPVNFPDSGVYPFDLIGLIIGSEAAAAFDPFTRSGLDDEMDRQGIGEWPNYFRSSRFIPAAEYINANRHRYQLMEKMNAFMRQFDVIICPSWAGNQLAITNLTGHPAVSVPTGFGKSGLPTGISLIGNLYDEATLLQVAEVFQDATPWNKMHPPFVTQP